MLGIMNTPNFFKLNKPKTKRESLKIELPFEAEFLNAYNFYSEQNYFYFDQLKDSDFKEELWFLIKELRKTNAQKTPFVTPSNINFTFKRIQKFNPILSKIDLFKTKRIKEKNARERYIASNLLNEVKEESEAITLANFNAITSIKKEHIKKPMSLELLNEMYKDIALNKDYRLRKENEHSCIKDSLNKTIYHTAPDSFFIQNELNKFIDFANKNTTFHPIIKAIIMYFWIAYTRPYTKANDELARNLFYFSVFKDNYDIFPYLPLWSLIRDNHDQYLISFVRTTQDNADLTYFIDFFLDQINMSLNTFIHDLKKENKKTETAREVQSRMGLNIRQFGLLQFLYLNPDKRTSIDAFQKQNKVSRRTASEDLNLLVKRKFLRIKRIKNRFFYYPIFENIEKTLKAL